MGWRKTFNNSDWIMLSSRSATSSNRYADGVYINGAFVQTGWTTVTKTAKTTTWESRCYTQAAIEAAGLADTVSVNAQGDITFSRNYEIQRQNEADAYKAIKTEMTVTITVT